MAEEVKTKAEAEPLVLGIGLLVAYRDKPNSKTQADALVLLKRTGPLVLDGVLYSADGEKIAQQKTQPSKVEAKLA
jgi:hypothetical protein